MKFLRISLFIILSILACSVTTTAQTAQAPAASTIETHTFKVKGATCKTDLGIIETKIEKIEGVKSCELIKRGRISTLEVEYDTAAVDNATIQEAIETCGTCKDPNARKFKVKTIKKKEK